MQRRVMGVVHNTPFQIRGNYMYDTILECSKFNIFRDLYN
jgi:hypothetical protein